MNSSRYGFERKQETKGHPRVGDMDTGKENVAIASGGTSRLGVVRNSVSDTLGW